MKFKKLLAAVLAAVMMFSCLALPSSAFIGESIFGSGVSDSRRTVEGLLESAFRVIRAQFEIRKYKHYSELCTIPETENGYVPQGFCFSETQGLYFVSYYHSSEPSIIAVIDAESGERLKTVSLKRDNGSAFKGHAGGIAEDGTYFYVVDGSAIYRMTLDYILGLADGSSAVMAKKIETDVKCSYLNSDGEYLYAGEFYTYTQEGSYDTDSSHHMKISLFETTYSRCNAYRISDVADKFTLSGGEAVVPAMIFTTPNCVQGFARTADGGFALSTSYGRNNDSFLKLYDDVTAGESDFTVGYSGIDVPAYHLSKCDACAKWRQPPMLEGIDDCEGQIVGIFESGAKKYSDSAFIVNKICEFK